MYLFHSIKDLLHTLSWSKDLLSEMFGKRKSFDYRYDHAVELLDEDKVQALVEKGVLQRNGRFVELGDQFLEFFEQILEVNEEISVSYISDHIQQLRENINYYLVENSESRKNKYLKAVKSSLRRIGIICMRNIVDLTRNIDNTFKSEPNYRIKISKLENHDRKRHDINALIAQTEKLITHDELTFFSVARDEELHLITIDLRNALHEATHHLIEIQKQIIDFLNQVKHQSQVLEKMRQVKYLKDQFELQAHSNIIQLLSQNTDMILEPRPGYSTKLSPDIYQEDFFYELKKDLHKKILTHSKLKIPVAGMISQDYLDNAEEAWDFLNLEEIKNSFTASGHHLFDFIMQYDFSRKVSFEEKATCYCQIISLYEDELKITDQYMSTQGLEYLVVLPK